MKVVVADTSPINYLILVDAIEILPRLYGRVTIPDVVLQELADEEALQMSLPGPQHRQHGLT